MEHDSKRATLRGYRRRPFGRKKEEGGRRVEVKEKMRKFAGKGGNAFYDRMEGNEAFCTAKRTMRQSSTINHT